ncbi:MAG: Rv2175c family DNA-binding protein [Gordonia sp. (in: high G+C Gram-positive bacteria)]
MSSLPLSLDTLPAGVDTYTLDEVAAILRVSPGRVRTLIRDHHLLAVSRAGQPAIPRVFFDEAGIAKHFNGIVGVLLDGGYTRDEVLVWLFTPHDDLGLTPADALHTDSAREVIRRAQAQAF